MEFLNIVTDEAGVPVPVDMVFVFYRLYKEKALKICELLTEPRNNQAGRNAQVGATVQQRVTICSVFDASSFQDFLKNRGLAGFLKIPVSHQPLAELCS